MACLFLKNEAYHTLKYTGIIILESSYILNV